MIFALESNENKVSNPFDMSTIGDFYSSQFGREYVPGAIHQAEEQEDKR